MDFNWIWKAVLIVLVGTLLLRLAGRKSISQMTVAQTVIMISIGSLLIQPVSGRNLWVTFGVGGILVLTLLVMEYVQMKANPLEGLFSGHGVLVVENGAIHEKNMRKLRMTVDQLEVRLRQSNITKISDVKWAVLESNGQLGYELFPTAQPATKQDIQDMIQFIQTKFPYPANAPQVNQSNETGDIFSEVKHKKHMDDPPKHLQ